MEKFRLAELRENFEKLMECPVCMERLQAPVSTCQNGHPLCHKCSQTINRSCPLCQASFKFGQNTFINQMINSFPFRCKYSIEGCQELMVPEYLTKHEERCDYRYVECPLLNEDSTPCHSSSLIPLLYYSKHVEEHHKSYITKFAAPEWEYTGILPTPIYTDKVNCYFSVLHDSWRKKFFLLMTYYDIPTKTYQLSVHHLGKDAEASNYIFTIKMSVKDHIMGMCYSAKCLPNIMTPEEAKKYDPLEVKNTNARISKQREIKFYVTVKHEDDFNKRNPYTDPVPVPKRVKRMDDLINPDNVKNYRAVKDEKNTQLWAPYTADVVDLSP